MMKPMAVIGCALHVSPCRMKRSPGNFCRPICGTAWSRCAAKPSRRLSGQHPTRYRARRLRGWLPRPGRRYAPMPQSRSPTRFHQHGGRV
ncbi:MAG: hypothetical protein WBC07_01450 [Methylotenera sp.]